MSSRAQAHALTVTCIGMLLTATPGVAQESGFHPIDSALEMLNMKTETKAMPDFVEQSRSPGDNDYLPVGTQHPVRTEKIKTPAEIKAAEAELDAARDAQVSGKRPKPAAVQPKKAKAPLQIAPAVATNR